MFRWENLTSHLVGWKTHATTCRYNAPVGDWTHDLPHTVASNIVKVSHSATEAVTLRPLTICIYEKISDLRENLRYCNFYDNN